jgi:hypothetical protein
VAGVADPATPGPATPEPADGELRSVAPVPMPAALLPTLPQPATMRTIAAAHHGRHIRPATATTVFRISYDVSDNR